MSGLQAQQICALARQIAKTLGFTSQSGQLLNAILSDLAQQYDLKLAQGTFLLQFNTAQAVNATLYPNVTVGGGPYPLPTDFLRIPDPMEAMWFLLGVPYPMIPCDISEFDNFVQQAGLASYPYVFATDMSQTPPNLLVYPPPSGNYSGMIRYQRQMPDIVMPETSATVPWFPNTNYLITRLAGELMKIADDTRVTQYLGDGTDQNPGLAAGILRLYLDQKDD